MSLTFTEENHEYCWNGKPVVSVTQVLKPLTKLWTNGADLERARQEGRAIHRMVELECKGELDRESLPEWLQPIYAEWLKFVAMTGFELRLSEKPLYHRTYAYAGTPDLDGILTKVKGKPFAVIDVKRTLGSKTNVFQTAAYEKLLSQDDGIHRRRVGLQLNPPRFPEYENPNDWADFLTCLSWHRLQQRMGGAVK